MTSRWAEDAYPTDYQGKVQAAFGPIPHDFFIREKANWLLRFCDARGLR